MKVKGWKEVFAFTFVQQIKTKSFIIGTVVMMIIVAFIAALANILPVFFLGNGQSTSSGGGPLTVETLYVSNETGKYSFDFTDVLNDLAVKYVKLDGAADAEAKIKELEAGSERGMVSRIILDEGRIFIDSRFAGGESGISKGDAETLNSLLGESVDDQYLRQIGVPDDEMKTVLSGVRTSVSAAGEEPVSVVKMILNAVVPMVSAIVLFIFIFAYSQLVAQSVAIEKSSRIVEYLLTSIKPLALIIGKVLAMCCVSLLQFMFIGFGGTFGFLVSMPFGILSKVGDVVQTAEAAVSADEASLVVGDLRDAFSGIDASALVIMIVTFVLGFLFYAGLAGLAGASISKMEDLSSAIQPISLFGVLGFYLAYFPQVTGEDNTMAVIARYVPISSPFILTSDYMLGKIDLPQTLISIGILLAADILIMMFVAKVYESIILHTGNRLKIGDMLKLSK